jgi:hypothetical protein
MNSEQALQSARNWSNATIRYAISIDNATKTGLPKEIYEQQIIKAETIVDRLFGESIVECGVNAPLEHVAITVVRKTLDWVVEYRSKRQ